MKRKNTLVELWGDVIAIKDLVLSISLTGLTSMGAYFFAPGDGRTQGLFYGLGGGLLGFVLSSLLIRPKRIINLENNSNNKE